MGDEIPVQHFRQQDFQRFDRHVHQEMETLKHWFDSHALSDVGDLVGLELEAWLVHQDGSPAAENDAFLSAANQANLVAELSRFNFELNVTPQRLEGLGLHHMHGELAATWQASISTAHQLNLDAILIGTLPTLKDDALRLSNLSTGQRYAALNEQVMRLRQGKPITLDITGIEDRIQEVHYDVMLEAGATSLQIHRQIPQSQAVRYFNASIVASPYTVGFAANAPLLFGRNLWSETRVPLAEQSVDTGATGQRVTFGSGYAQQSLYELFQENIRTFPVMLPVQLDKPSEKLPHVRLHNGTIWRWNRPLIGFNPDGQPHLRIEHRVMSAGPTIMDVMLNASFAVGLIEYLARLDKPPELSLPFDVVREDFYNAARLGWDADLHWHDGSKRLLQNALSKHVFAAAAKGLNQLNVAPEYTDWCLSNWHARAEKRLGGADWQRAWLRQHAGDLNGLVRAYIANQASNRAVSEWS